MKKCFFFSGFSHFAMLLANDINAVLNSINLFGDSMNCSVEVIAS